MIPLLGLLKNPLTKLIFEKTAGAISHKLKKDAIIRDKEIQNAQNVDLQSLKSSDNSLKDEWLVIVFSLIFLVVCTSVLIKANYFKLKAYYSKYSYLWLTMNIIKKKNTK